MEPSNRGLELIQAWEGLEDGDPSTVNLEPYMDHSGYWTIGWGHLLTDANGRRMEGEERREEAYAVFPNGLTKEEATALFAEDCLPRVGQLNRLLNGAPTTQEQFDALFSLLYNIGSGNMSRSRVLAAHKNQDYANAYDFFMDYIYSKGQPSRGLKNRREQERAMYAETS